MKFFTLFAFILQTFAAAAMDKPSRSVIRTGDGVGLHYAQSGPRNGRRILFITGWRQAAAEWRKQVEHFSSSGFRVTTFDMRGHGESEEPDFGYRISRFAADLNDVLSELNLCDVTVVGHSMGCSVAWAWWDQYPDSRKRIAKFVFADQAPIMTRNPAWTDNEAAQYSAIFTPESLYDLANNLAIQGPPLIRSMFTTSVSEADLEWVISQNNKMTDAHAATLLIDHGLNDWRDVFPRITIPTLVIGGELSVMPPQGIEWVASKIPAAKSHIFTAVENGSHFVFWENPERFNELVEKFIRQS